MSEKHTILKGTFILTATGFLSRFIGFFYRMFLSHTFGEESVGLYQLISPSTHFAFRSPQPESKLLFPGASQEK